MANASKSRMAAANTYRTRSKSTTRRRACWPQHASQTRAVTRTPATFYRYDTMHEHGDRTTRSTIMSSPWISALRSVALEVPDLRRALAFYTDVWHLDVAARTDDALYLRGAGDDHHLLALHVSVGAPRIRYVTLRAHDRAALHAIAEAAERAGGTILSPVAALKDDPARGVGLTLKDTEGRVFQIVCEDKLHTSYLEPTDRPVRLAHAVLNASNLENTQRFVEDVFGFVLSDRTRLMAFMNCNRDHHTLALGNAENNALNHIAFLLPTLDAVMRGAGRMRDHGYPIEWPPRPRQQCV
jgi:catechol 2,3-dioxygenase